MAENLYDVARRVTDEVLGEGAYAVVNAGNPNPAIQQALVDALVGRGLNPVEANAMVDAAMGEMPRWQVAVNGDWYETVEAPTAADACTEGANLYRRTTHRRDIDRVEAYRIDRGRNLPTD